MKARDAAAGMTIAGLAAFASIVAPSAAVRAAIVSNSDGSREFR
jgi:hypothetical protein